MISQISCISKLFAKVLDCFKEIFKELFLIIEHTTSISKERCSLFLPHTWGSSLNDQKLDIHQMYKRT